MSSSGSSAGSSTSVLSQVSELYNLSESSLIVLATCVYILAILAILSVVSACFVLVRRARLRRRNRSFPGSSSRVGVAEVEELVIDSPEAVEGKKEETEDDPPEYFEALKDNYKKFWRGGSQDYCCTPPPRFNSLIP